MLFAYAIFKFYKNAKRLENIVPFHATCFICTFYSVFNSITNQTETIMSEVDEEVILNAVQGVNIHNYSDLMG